MKFVTFAVTDSSSCPADPSKSRLGALVEKGRSVVDLQAAFRAANKAPAPYFHDMLVFLDHFDQALVKAAEMVDYATAQQVEGAILALDDLTLFSPVLRPRSLRDCMTFHRHYIQAARTYVRRCFRPLAALDAGLERLFGRGLIRFPRVGSELPI